MTFFIKKETHLKSIFSPRVRNRSSLSKSFSGKTHTHTHTHTHTQTDTKLTTITKNKTNILSHCVHAQSLNCVWLFETPMDCSPPGFSAHVVSQARTLEQAAISFSRWWSWPREGIQVSFIFRQILHHWTLGSPIPSTAAASAAKSLESCPTLCDPIDGSPPRLRRPWDSPGKNTGVGCHFLLQCMKVKSESEVAQSCPTLHNPMDCSPPGSSAHGIFQVRVLEWVATAFSDSFY